MNAHAAVSPSMPAIGNPSGAWRRSLVIALISFLTLVDLFAAQAILPSLTKAYGVTPAAMGLAVNASTIGMAVAGLAVAFFSKHIDRRKGIGLSLALLTVPTALLATMPGLGTFTVLRIAQGLCMSAAFTLTVAYLAEQCSATEAAGALAAYITGNVASNLFGRLISASVADHFGLSANFALFAALNLAGGVIAYLSLARTAPMTGGSASGRSPLAAWAAHFRNPALRAAFAIGFIILFAFIGTFTYVNFVLVGPPIGLGAMTLGVVYLVFLPAIFTTPLAGRAVGRIGTRPTFWAALAVAGAGLPLMLLPGLVPVLAGMVLVACGTFFAQAAATGFVGRAAKEDRGAASGLYLASYYAGGLAGSFALGQIYDGLGWPATVLAIGASLAAAAILAFKLRVPEAA